MGTIVVSDAGVLLFSGKVLDVGENIVVEFTFKGE